MDKDDPGYRGPRNFTATFGATAVCVCPRCNKRYKRFIYWTGRGTPRVYCAKCLVRIQHYEEPDKALV